MKKINVTIISGGVWRFPGCADILGDFSEFRIVAHTRDLYDSGTWIALGQSDVVLLDEAVVGHDDPDTLRTICDSYPELKVLLILDDENEDLVLEAIGLGVTGIMERSKTRTQLRKAIPALYAGESWISRELVHSLRKQLKQERPGKSDDPKFPFLHGRRIYN
jgi:DNA-binding NarL/FixJ family response regulator